ncbi:MAG: GGDEF domain-containing protein [Thermoanaerobaculia bacterium]
MDRPTHALLQDLLAAKAELEARNEALQLVNDLSHRLQRRLDVEAIAAETVDVLTRHSGAPLVAFYLLDGEQGPLRMVAGCGFNEREMALGAVLALDGSASGRAVREGRIVAVRPAREGEGDAHPVVRALAERRLANGLCIPLLHGDSALGTVNILFPEDREVRPLELDTFQGIARAVSLALANARLVADLEHLAFHDLLTGLPNRAALHRRFAAIGGGNGGPKGAGLVLLNLDRFRQINDTLGHNVGDELLVQVVGRLVAARGGRREDVFRLGGDDFAVVVPGAQSLAVLEAAARELLAALARPLKVAGMGLEIGASAGIALFPGQGRDSHELLRCADVALHRAKKTPGGVAAYARELDEHTPERLAMLSELARAIREGELALHFQPKVALQYGFIEGFEALVRWKHPRLGLLASGRFVPIAEATDVIQPLTSWVVRNALEQLARWNGALPRLTMAINLSMRNLLDRGCPERLEEIVREVGVNPNVVEYELTETAIMADPETALEALKRITSSGPRLAVDDFGTGYSSLSYLKRLPVDVLKIDRSFVADMGTGDRGLAIVRSTVQLAHSLELGVVAEGVESRESARTLREMKCDFAQGFYVAYPEPAEDAGRHLARGGWIDVPV